MSPQASTICAPSGTITLGFSFSLLLSPHTFTHAQRQKATSAMSDCESLKSVAAARAKLEAKLPKPSFSTVKFPECAQPLSLGGCCCCCLLFERKKAVCVWNQHVCFLTRRRRRRCEIEKKIGRKILNLCKFSSDLCTVWLDWLLSYIVCYICKLIWN